ncbi:MAG: short-chain dehydrogenase [Cycloclasticus sp. symbiont of Poecilosclerida sp. M]|nr:MAG: short-chain dehydrogenase [Cycloclasticus sp. symbiont of Poecilosclerida sp. M]
MTEQACTVDNSKLTDKCLDKKVYLITGASGGLGRATALSLAKYGGSVILSGRNTEKLEQLYDQIEDAEYPQAAIFPFDLLETNEDKYKSLSKSISNEFNQLDGVIYAACELGYVAPIKDQDTDMWLKVQQVNLHAPFMLSKACLPLMLQSDSASCLFISDSSARSNKAYWGSYGVSKTALENFSARMADELESTSICCNVFVPGPSLLPIRKKTHPAEQEAELKTADELARAITGILLQRETGKTYQL